MGLGINLRRFREQRNLTLEELASISEVDLGTISALEVRRSTRSKFAGALAKALHVSLEDLLADAPHESFSAFPTAPQIKEPTAAFQAAVEWPLPGVTPKEFFGVLTATDRAQVVGFVAGLLMSRRAQGSAAL